MQQQSLSFDLSDEESLHSSSEHLNHSDYAKSNDGTKGPGGWSIVRHRRSHVAVAAVIALILSGVFIAIGISVKQHDGRTSSPNTDSTKSGTNNRTNHATPPPTATADRSAPSASPAPGTSPSNAPPAPTGCPTTYATQHERSPLAGKRGVAFTMREPGEMGSYEENLPKVLALDPYWYYSWSATVPDQVRQQTDGIEYVPMIWGTWSSSGLSSTLDQLTNDTRVKRILGFNEPDKAKQANMNASDALRYWAQIESTVPHIPLVSPACAHPDGEWMQDFMSGLQDAHQRQVKNTNGCSLVADMEHVAVHWYGPPDVETFQGSIRSYHDLYNMTLMITEFAVADWDATSVQENRYSRYEVLEFMKSVLPWLESQDWVAAYAWFPFDITDPVGTSSSLFDRSGNLTRLGLYYQSVTNDNQVGNQSISVWNGYN